MLLKFCYVGFSGNPGFPNCDILGRFYKSGETNVSNPQEANVLIIGNFVQPHEIPIIANFSGIRVLYIAEPITKLPMCAFAGHIYTNDLCDYYIGCVSDGPKSIKYPYYAYDTIDYEAVNNYTKTCELYGKQFCTLINRHDWGNTRTPIYETLNQIYHVVCPGKLHNNCSNEEVDRIGNMEYIKKFIFNICSENFGTSHPGYITEKIKNCVLGGAIPVYYGALDHVDELVFNKNRILFVNSTNVAEVGQRVKHLAYHPMELIEYYKQPPFMPTAKETVNQILSNVEAWFAKLREQVAINSSSETR